MDSRSLFSLLGILDKEVRSDYLKFCFLWYDEVIYENIGEPDTSNLFEEFKTLNKDELKILTDILVPVENKVPEDILFPNGKFDSRGYPRWGSSYENYTYPEPQNTYEYAHNKLLEILQKRWGIEKPVGGYIEHMEGTARVTVDAVSMWERVNRYLPCVLESNELEKEAMIAIAEYKKDGNRSIKPVELFEVIIPQLRNISWKKIIKIKKETKITSLRDKLTGLVKETSADNVLELKKEFDSIAVQVVNQIVQDSRPKTRKVIFESILSNIPGIPFVNPFGLFFGTRDILKEYRKKDETEWIYTLRDIKRDLENNT